MPDPDPDELVARLRAAGCVFAEEEAARLESALSAQLLEDAVGRRAAGEPLEWILGFVEFADRRFRLDPGVFIPRRRSEALVREAAALCSAPNPRILDLCCGCGALGLALRALVGGQLVASDSDPRAVVCARSNGVVAQLGDLFEAAPQEWSRGVDIVVCNAPYVPTGEIGLMPRDSRDHEDRSLVDGGHDGLAVLARVVREAPEWLAPSGRLHVECSPVQAASLHALARDISSIPYLHTSVA